MKQLVIVTCIALTATSATAQVFNEDVSETIVLEGEINEVVYDAISPEPLTVAGQRFRATIAVNRYAALEYDLPQIRQYFDAVASIVFEVFDAQGMPVDLPIETHCDDTVYADAFGNRLAYAYLSDGQIDSASYAIQNTTRDNSFLSCGFRLTEVQPTLFNDTVGFPIPLEGDTVANFRFRVESGSMPVNNPTGIFYGEVEQITVSGFDSDGDGIADELDACGISITAETVAFDGWYETGVTNYVDESGCSIMDLYAACEAEAEAQPAIPAGPVFSAYSGPSYCETQVVYGLQIDGVIDYTESRMLRNALYNYHRSGGNGPS
ncbi:hypothetical protein IDAT_05455 [Pseudidiomarina atlantica]|jgi:hypothetical protein|uniref:EF-hand domain-containing protein n=1 Tax=Pseudidiomarina atlantica TaxID=1517416 RepID=A0A094IPR7_9GAMM|nr:hypothetical protein [Pseudidiomarina atlantica]KFZ29122.1 hypothetical protein IDAT_05455 [Pseudidiomarina atlantica]